MSKCSRFGQKASRAGAILAAALVSSVLLPATSAGPLPPELDPVQQLIDRTLDYAQGFDPSNATQQYEESKSFISAIQDIVQQTLCIDFHIGQVNLYIGQIDTQLTALDIELPGVGWDHGYFGQGTYYLTGRGNSNLGCAVPVDNAPPIEYNATVLDRR
jgi:hypothetical protein